MTHDLRSRNRFVARLIALTLACFLLPTAVQNYASADPGDDPCVDNPDGNACTGDPGYTPGSNRAPDAPSQVAAVPGDPLRAVVTDPDGGTLYAQFTVQNASGTTIWSGSSAAVASGTEANVTVPDSIFTPGSTYMVGAQAFDGLARSASVTMTPLNYNAPTISPSPTCGSECIAVSSATLLDTTTSADVLLPSESRTVAVVVPNADSSAIRRLMLTGTISGWNGGSSGAVSVFNPDQTRVDPIFSWNGSTSPSVGVNATLSTSVSDVNTVVVKNQSSSPVEVKLSITGFTPVLDDNTMIIYPLVPL